MSLAESPFLKRGDSPSRSSRVANNTESGFENSAPRTTSDISLTADMDSEEKNTKGKKRSLFGFGKKKAESSSKQSPDPDAPTLAGSSQVAAASARAPGTAVKSPTRAAFGEHPVLVHPSSPTRALSSPPRVSSPAGSQIFERDVQDSTVLKPNSPAIPTHIQTENHIPSVLNDASEAITNEKLDPDAVEIVTHTSHQPASVTVTGSSAGLAPSPHDQPSSEWAAELASFADRVGLPPETASNYGSLDSVDVRRLSFISFADVVQAEHSTQVGSVGSRENVQIAGMTGLSSAAANRSPSPVRSPVSSQEHGTSPPTSNSGSLKGVDLSLSQRSLSSPKPTQSLAAPSGDFNVQTMRQALRRTGSTDMSSFRSNPTSHPTSPIEGPGSR
ncbi:hypothetical protein AAL_00742 [Moelleriella libera RCEF 2490]|uniref:Uncharacterized protein n=1 Tax=Moelleriella libera RCEF 2490 TaxID=1081109 RepID=A0A166V542_9HYPO|nr:hypothetical protein AAL_00742 [Moelleriella libera RCEF 2490]